MRTGSGITAQAPLAVHVRPQKPAPHPPHEKTKLAARRFASFVFLPKCFLNIWCLRLPQMAETGRRHKETLTRELGKGALSMAAGFVLGTPVRAWAPEEGPALGSLCGR